LKKKTIQRLEELKTKVSQLSDYYYSEVDFKEYSNTNDKSLQNKILERIESRVDEKNELYRQILAFLRANLDRKENVDYFENFGRITFRPKQGLIYNTFYYLNNEAWKDDKTRLINLLDLLKSEFKERMSSKKSLDNEKKISEINIFSSVLFWTILIASTGTGFFLGSYKAEYDKTDLKKELKLEKEKNLKLQEEKNNLIYKLKNTNLSK
jgi:hypothetical protein